MFEWIRSLWAKPEPESLTEFAREIAGLEGGKKQVSIAQLSEIAACYGAAFKRRSPKQRRELVRRLIEVAK